MSTNIRIALKDIASKVNGSLVGEPEYLISGVGSLEDSSSDEISFYKGVSSSALKKALSSCKAGALLVCNKLKGIDSIKGRNFISVEDPMHAIVELAIVFGRSDTAPLGISKNADISSSAKLAAGVSVGAFSVIGDFVEIGSNSKIYPHVTIYRDCRIGDNCIIHSGVVIREGTVIGPNSRIQNGAILGSDGFGYYLSPSGLTNVPQVGTVILGSNVEVGANSCVDRGTFGPTIIQDHTKIDNQVQIGHNVKIGRYSILCGQVGVAGSAKIGSNVTVGGNVGIADHVEVTDNVRIGAKSGVSRNLLEPGDYSGYPAVKASDWRRQLIGINNLGRKKARKKDSIKRS